MRAHVSNQARGARGFHTADGGTVMLEPGEAKTVELANHALHRAWEEAGEVTIVVEDSPATAPARKGVRSAQPPAAGAGRAHPIGRA